MSDASVALYLALMTRRDQLRHLVSVPASVTATVRYLLNNSSPFLTRCGAMSATRRSSRRRSPAESETPSTNVSPLFSKANTEVASADSDIELVEEKVDLESTAMKTALDTKKRKRTLNSDGEGEEAIAATSATKRRLLANSFAKVIYLNLV
jgi:hypothetical protein